MSFFYLNFLNSLNVRGSFSINEWFDYLVSSRTSSLWLLRTTLSQNCTLNLFISHCEKPRNLIVNSFFFYPVIENSRIPHPNKFTLSTLFPIIRKLAGKRFSKSFCWFIEVSARSRRVKKWLNNLKGQKIKINK